jgi:ribonuclease Z
MLRLLLAGSRSCAGARLLATSATGRRKLVDKRTLDSLLFEMPKEEPHLRELKQKRMVKRSKRALTQPASIAWQVVGTGARGAARSLLLHTDHRRYLFNCGEGTQRLTNQLGLSRSLSQLEHVFITSKSWANLGGLPGMCLTARASGAPDVTIHGPPGCMELYEATKNFILLFEFDVLRHRLEDGPYCDGAVTVQSTVLARAEPSAAPAVAAEWEGLPAAAYEDGGLTYEDSAVAYVCSFAPKPGRLDMEACVDRGVPPGPLLGKLKAGQDVTLEDGTVVSAAEVVAEAAPPVAYMVLEVPDPLYLPALEAAAELRDVQHLVTVFHFSPAEVVRDPRYRAWLAALGPAVSHVFINEASVGLGLPDVASYQHKLRTVRPDLFPALEGAAELVMVTEQVEGAGRCVQASSGLRVEVRPCGGLQPPEAAFNPAAATTELLEGNEKLVGEEERAAYRKGMLEDLEYARTFSPDRATALASKLRALEREQKETGGPKRVRVEEQPRAPEGEYPVVTFLGTGSSVPSKYRNVSAILVETEPASWILLDCGEGTLGQLVRLLGWPGAARVLRGLKAVYISHQHADHHMGAINVMLHREEAFRAEGLAVEGLAVLATRRMAEFLTYYHSKLQPILCHAELFTCEHLLLHDSRDVPGEKVQLIYPDRMAGLLERLGLAAIATCKAIHCPHAFCLSLTTSAGFKMAYSGDTRPCPAFRELGLYGGRGPDLLIHEATMEHFMITDAKIKKHSTLTEAMDEGEGMEAAFTLLTHFSQRYAKLPALAELAGRSRVGVAFDNMAVRPSQLAAIPALYPALSRWARGRTALHCTAATDCSGTTARTWSGRASSTGGSLSRGIR